MCVDRIRYFRCEPEGFFSFNTIIIKIDEYIVELYNLIVTAMFGDIHQNIMEQSYGTDEKIFN